MASIVQNLTNNTDTSVAGSERRTVSATAAVALTQGSIYGLVGLHSITLAALYAGIEPHPPAAFAPLIGATIASGLFALPLLRAGNRNGYSAAIVFAILSLVSFGPHKFIIADGVEIYPALIAGTALCVMIIAAAVVTLRTR